MPSQSLLQLRPAVLHPAPNRCVIDIETALLQQLLNIAQRKRIAKIPPDRTKYEAGFGLPPFEDRGSGYHFAILSRHQPAALKVATHPSRGGIQAVFEAWEAACPSQVTGGEELERYYASAEFKRDFTHFVRSTYLQGTDCDGALDALLRLGANVLPNPPGRSPARIAGTRTASTKQLPHTVVPVPYPGIGIFDFDVDIRAIMDSLRRGDGLPAPSLRRVTIATRPRRPQNTDIMELTPLSASFLKLCDGRTLDRVAEGLEIDAELESLGPQQVGLLTFRELCRQRLLTWR